MSQSAAVRLYRSLRDATKHRKLPRMTKVDRFQLPPELIPLDSPAGYEFAQSAKLNAALQKNVQVQEHPAFCAMASAATIAAAADRGVGEQARFVDVFREAPEWPPVFASYGLGWDLLDSLPLAVKARLIDHLKYDGFPLTLLELWFRVQGYEAEVIEAADSARDLFYEDLRKAFGEEGQQAGERETYLLVNYSRTAIGQRMFSGGHYATIGGYNKSAEKALLLEVNAWRYPSVWVDVETLWGALHTQTSSATWRGYLRVVAPSRQAAQAQAE
eukprot:TRINITY_DN28047_c0_g1_i2.p1 TRINITY_DN28047_c0_g1~~TRINITY_DN28047_c0_g1_i2.p1  ORF type:complete len:295 (-),score=43.40 TRINITY_DN28047_c0_g1_i2:16-834(-)